MTAKSTLKTEDAVAHFEGKPIEVARALGISKQAVSKWGEFVPLASALLLEKLTDGALQAQESTQ